MRFAKCSLSTLFQNLGLAGFGGGLAVVDTAHRSRALSILWEDRSSRPVLECARERAYIVPLSLHS